MTLNNLAECLEQAKGGPCQVEVYLGEGIWWRTDRRNLPTPCNLPVRRSPYRVSPNCILDRL